MRIVKESIVQTYIPGIPPPIHTGVSPLRVPQNSLGVPSSGSTFDYVDIFYDDAASVIEERKKKKRKKKKPSNDYGENLI